MGKISIIEGIWIDEDEIKISFIRSPGPGGQNVNKVATAALLRFNINQSASLPPAVRARLLISAGNRVNFQGELLIKASRFRTQERNKQDALDRLQHLIQQAAVSPKKRYKTKPTFAARQRRLASKKLHSRVKSLRREKPNKDD